MFQPVTTTAEPTPEFKTERNKTDIEKLRIEYELAELYLEKARKEAAREPIAYLNADREFWFRIGVAILVALGLISGLSRFQELSLSLFGTTVSFKQLPLSKPPATVPKAVANQKAQQLNIAPEAVEKQVQLDTLSAAAVNPDSISLCHRITRRLPRARQIEVFLQAEQPADLQKIKEVEYVPHPHISANSLRTTDARNGFAMTMIVDAEFMMYALVDFDTGLPPVRLKRFINLS